LPVLLPSKRDGASKLLTLIGKQGNAKEVVIAIQEALEHIEIVDHDGDVDHDEDFEEKSETLSCQLLNLLIICKDGTLGYVHYPTSLMF
jgi:hypothetical protein